jgi:hypothetical protein
MSRHRSPVVSVFENLSKALCVSPLGHVALLRLFEPARVQIKRRCGLIWHEKKGQNPSFAIRSSSFAKLATR